MASAGNGRTYKLNMIVPNPAYSQFILQLKNPTTQFALTNMSDFNATPPHADQSQADCSSWLNILALLLQGILIIAMLWLGQRAFQLLQGEIQSQHDNLESLQTWVGKLDNDLNELRTSQPLSAGGLRGMATEKELRGQYQRLDFMNERNAVVIDMLKREFSETVEELGSSNQICMLADLLEEEEEERKDGLESEQNEKVELDGMIEDDVPELSGEPQEIDVEESASEESMCEEASEDEESVSEESVGEQASDDGSDGETGMEDARESSGRPARTFAAADGRLIRVRLPWLQEAEESKDLGETY